MFKLRQNVISNKNVNVNINVVLNVKVFQSKCVFWIIPLVYNGFLYYLYKYYLDCLLFTCDDLGHPFSE